MLTQQTMVLFGPGTASSEARYLALSVLLGLMTLLVLSPWL